MVEEWERCWVELMDIYDQILENLELERELGTRMVEIDRALLVPPKPQPVAPTPAPISDSLGSEAPVASSDRSKLQEQRIPEADSPAAVDGQRSTPSPETGSPQPSAVAAKPGSDIEFVTARPLSAAGMEAMAKTIVAMKRIKPDLQVSINEGRKPKLLIFLGSDAMKKFRPAMRPVRGKWVDLDGVPALMTFSPDYIFSHFQEGSPRMKEAKRDMWNDIKSAVARIPS